MKRWRTDGAARPSLAAALAFLLVAAAAGSPGAGDAESPRSPAGIFSPAKLERLGDYLRKEIATGKIPGAIILVQQHGHPVYFKKLGVIDVATRRPMSEDAIFRLYSMSKPITSVAAMMLVEDGKLALNDPLSKYIPAFAKVDVRVEKRDADGGSVLAREPLNRPISVEDLLRHTSGLTYGFYGDSAVRKLYANSDL
ncbi:MAG: serine hydrolase domain-containing protein, partial [Bradyrhizobium sp.]